MKTLTDLVTLKKLTSDINLWYCKWKKQGAQRMWWIRYCLCKKEGWGVIQETNNNGTCSVNGVQSRWGTGMRGRHFTKYIFINLESQHLLMKNKKQQLRKFCLTLISTVICPFLSRMIPIIISQRASDGKQVGIPWIRQFPCLKQDADQSNFSGFFKL